MTEQTQGTIEPSKVEEKKVEEKKEEQAPAS